MFTPGERQEYVSGLALNVEEGQEHWEGFGEVGSWCLIKMET